METRSAYTAAGIAVCVQAPFDETVARVKDALKAEGFGILTEIDVKATLKAKIDVDFHPYVILGACNPPLAHRALTANPAAGLFLPCNVVVEDTGAGCTVAAMDPDAMVTYFKSDEMAAVAKDARERLQRALKSVESD